MIYVRAFPGLWLFMFSCGICKATQNKNYLMLYYSTALLQTWEKSPLFSSGPEFPIYLFFVCAILYLSPGSPLTSPQTEERASSQVPFSPPEPTTHSVIHPFSTSCYQFMKCPKTLEKLPDHHRDQCSQGEHAKTWGHRPNWEPSCLTAPLCFSIVCRSEPASFQHTTSHVTPGWCEFILAVTEPCNL